MQITYKNKEEQEAMREGGKMLGAILSELAKVAKPGITTKQLDKKAHDMIRDFGTQPSFLGYHGFPGVICTAVNNEVVHTIPNERKLKNGDLLSIDGGVYHKGFHTDSAITIGIGEISPKLKKMKKVAEQALRAGIEKVKPDTPIREISKAIQEVIERNGYSVIRDLIGHGIGKKLHEDPPIPNYGPDAPPNHLKAGMAIAIEPIFAEGKSAIKTLSDGWNIITKDGSYAIQVEHTILVTDSGHEILTKRNEQEYF